MSRSAVALEWSRAASAASCPPSLAQAARGDAAAWFSPDDYPFGAMRRSAQGRTVARLAIGVDGRVTGCTIVSSSGDVDLDKTTCDVPLRRAHFLPARAADGAPIASTRVIPVRWVLPSGGDAAAPSPTPDTPPDRRTHHGWFERLIAAHHLIGGLTAIIAFFGNRLRRWATGRGGSSADPWPDGDRLPVRRRWRWRQRRWARVAMTIGPAVLLAAVLAWFGG